MDKFLAAIDPLALILSESAYLKLVELRHPNTPLTETLSQVAKEMTPAEKKTVVANLHAMNELMKAVSVAVERVAEKSMH